MSPPRQAAVGQRLMARIWRLLAPFRWTLVAGLVAVVVYVGSQMAMPLVISGAIDASRGDLARTLPPVMGLYALLVVTNGGGHFVQNWVAGETTQRTIFRLRREMFLRLQAIAVSGLEATPAGQIMSRLQGDLAVLQEFLEGWIFALSDFLMLAGVMAIIVAIDWRLGLLTLAGLPVLIAARVLWQPRAEARFRQARTEAGLLNAALAQNITGVRIVQSAGREDRNLVEFAAMARRNLDTQVRAAWAGQVMAPLVDLLTGLALAVAILVGAPTAARGLFPVGVVVAYVLYIRRLFDPVRSLSQQYTLMQRAFAAGERILEILEQPDGLAYPVATVAAQPSAGCLQFDAVTFGYAAEAPVIHDITFRVGAGETVALVGPTGSGKTTIASLALRLFDVWDGRVLLDGVDVRSLPRQALSRAVGIVLQEPYLFTGTVFDNILYSTPGASKAEAIEAAKAVRAHDFIERLPNGYDTALSPHGANLSAGQRQLLSFARTLVRDPRILVLDEATASIDSFTERDIQAALKVLFAGRSSLIIAHRLATIRHADRILVMNQGRIVEAGRHGELVAARGVYARLHDRSEVA